MGNLAMLTKKTVLLALLLASWNLNATEFMNDYFDHSDERQLSKMTSGPKYNDSSTEVTSQISEYENIIANKPIQVSIFVTHDSKNPVDIKSFRLGNKQIKVTFVQTTLVSSFSDLAVSVYNTQLEGLPIGTHVLPSINVKIGGKQFKAPPMIVEVSK